MKITTSRRETAAEIFERERRNMSFDQVMTALREELRSKTATMRLRDDADMTPEFVSTEAEEAAIDADTDHRHAKSGMWD